MYPPFVSYFLSHPMADTAHSNKERHVRGGAASGRPPPGGGHPSKHLRCEGPDESEEHWRRVLCGSMGI